MGMTPWATVCFNLNYAHNERPGRGPAQVMQFGFD